MINSEPEPEFPKLRVTGGLLLGRKRRRLAWAPLDEGIEKVVTVEYNKPHVIGFPWKVSGGYMVGPIVGPYTGLVCPGTVFSSLDYSGDGCQFYLIERYDVGVTYYSTPGPYFMDGRTLSPEVEIIQQPFNFTGDLNVPHNFDYITGSADRSTAAWLLSIIWNDGNGVYRVASGDEFDFPDDDPFSGPIDTPDDFIDTPI